MTVSITMNDSAVELSAILLGLEGLRVHTDYHTVIYILRALYRIVLKSGRLNESQAQLRRRIARFEKRSHLPAFFSVLPVKQFLAELEDAQYYYPICHQEITFPTFH